MGPQNIMSLASKQTLTISELTMTKVASCVCGKSTLVAEMISMKTRKRNTFIW